MGYNPSYKWINPSYPIYNSGYNPLTKWDEPPSSLDEQNLSWVPTKTTRNYRRVKTPNLNVTGLVVAQHDPAGTEGNDQALAHIDILQLWPFISYNWL